MPDIGPMAHERGSHSNIRLWPTWEGIEDWEKYAEKKGQVILGTCLRLIRAQHKHIAELKESLEHLSTTGAQVLQEVNLKRIADLEGLLDQAAGDAVSDRVAPCLHPWHANPALITACPECGAG